MKKTFTVVSLFILSLGLQAQLVADQVTLNAGYSQQVWYSMANGEVGAADNTNWDIAFLTEGQNSSILINDNISTAIYLYSEDIADYANVDTTGFVGEGLNNDEVDWTQGVMQQLSTPNAFDYGWGVYNPSSNLLEGSKVFLVEFASGEMKKLIIEELNFGTYNFKYADVDGTNEVEASIDVTAYSSKNFVYYSMQNQEVLDREPVSADWDITFTRFDALVAPEQLYTVTGVNQNIGVEVAQASETPLDMAVYTDFDFEADKNIIGDDWKYFDMTLLQFIIVEDLSFFVKDQSGDVYHMAFTSFGGQMTGDIEFGTAFVAATSITEEQSISFGMYPNPASSEVSLVLPASSTSADLVIRNLTGSLVARHTLLPNSIQTLNISDLASGSYILELRMDGQYGIQRLIVD